MSLTQVEFLPRPADVAKAIKDQPYVALTGVNNSGKSSYLKGLWTVYKSKECSFLPVSRFIDSIELQTLGPGPMTVTPEEALFGPVNSDGNGAMNISALVRKLSNADRKSLFDVAQQWIGAKFSIENQDPSNTLSPYVFKSDGQPFNQTSTGTRLLFSMLVVLADSTNKRVLIDEPELGLSPNLQSMIFGVLSDQEERKKLFPHIEQVIVATHSHLFLDRRDLARNYIVEKETVPKVRLSAHQIPDVATFQAVQLRLLGNSLASFFLPEAIVVVEGKTDHPYIEKLVARELPGRNIPVISAQGDLKNRVYTLSYAMGGIQRTPYAGRLFAVFDKVIGEDQVQEIAKLGVDAKHIVRWKENGIEYLYPDDIVKKIFLGASMTDATIKGDEISANGINLKKAKLCEAVCELIDKDTKFPAEIQEKLITPLKAAIGAT